jgi:hypothetical protein
LRRLAAAAADCSTRAAFCCVVWSIWVMASPTWATPALCSLLAALISPTMSVTRRIAETTSVMVVPARSTRLVPCSTRSTLAPIRPLISLAASALRWARLRTSEATTAKPRPCSPARAASTAAFSARMLVWKAMPSITPMMSAILRELSLMPFMVSTTSATTSPPWVATLEALSASWLAARAVGVLAHGAAQLLHRGAVCSRAEAWCSVRADRSWLPWAISALAVATPSAFCRTSATRAARRPCIAERAQQLAGLVGRARRDLQRQVAVGDGRGRIDRLAHRARDGARGRPGQEGAQRHGQRGGRQQQGLAGAGQGSIALLALGELAGHALAQAVELGQVSVGHGWSWPSIMLLMSSPICCSLASSTRLLR